VVTYRPTDRINIRIAHFFIRLLVRKPPSSWGLFISALATKSGKVAVTL
jgi:hypothetical protein